MTERFKALRECRKADSIAMDFWGQKNPKCPHCGENVDIHDNELWDLYQEGEHEVECPHCDEAFTVSTRAEYSFNTDEADQDEEDQP